MSSSTLLRHTSRLAVLSRPSLRISPRTFTFSTSTLRPLKESDHDTPDLAEKNEIHKQDLLRKQKEGKGHWKPELASNSEEAVKADRSTDQNLDELQRKTAEHAEKKHKHGTSQDPGL
ncbi:hypothetical protein M430DRAFT_34132 [Amorphotheca resinae ATCC 22711]|uniref:Uncharacterized protein n=1 Tax=Amorphotheca resinae ATCC 22711 TaxID=857342 RepID=A0A2T3B5Z4_AMORE|nr:hypothetical protein M430DRAFT_34132 [Amorphotheca resinae ATCC 22711]PSS22153.1 hypothetical protein M430DRAFT_34132 [Amorphotheca resinae ATCC 22711]